ncbi:Isopullulanase [Cytospora mali]|uniref:Isopullulanase n=1 Tax=Cytospora mali TaxID=578113 RepID=A0A194VAJ1_CYTMA|nr:Isopullulanase [Valsa mali var. pyri (nom. inval.)]
MFADRLHSSLAVLSLALTTAVGGTAASENVTTSNSNLVTWWHDNGEINYQSPVQEGNVRQSHIYSTWVKSTSDSSATYYNSFVYETIPRNGQGQIITPGDPNSTTTEYDSITIEADVWITMAWTEFLYSSDAWVKVSRAGNNPSTADNVVIRPSNLDLTVTDDGEGNVYIHVPYRSQGYRFSVEFQDNLYSYHDGCDSTSCDFIQDWHPHGQYYAKYTDDTPVMSNEPHDALLIFASPFPTPDHIPDESAPSTYVVQPGRVPDLSSINNTQVYFAPGTHWMTATDHAVLSSSVDWVYLAAGAYVKGAIQFTTTSPTIKATGHGVLSGEQYVYQANVADGYKNNQSNEDCLRMWSGYSTAGLEQTFVLTGLTTNAPPFNSIDFTGDLESIAINQWDYKQVGAFFGQTDGTTLYAGSSVRDTFYHSNDDTIKTYGSDVQVRDLVVWKGKTAPTVQFGWASRNVSGITVDGVDVIHMKYNANSSHPSIIGANQIYNYPETETDTADLRSTVKDIYFGNIRAEGIGGNLMRIVPLANYHNITIENVSLGNFSTRSTGIYRSELPLWTDGSGNNVSLTDFVIRNFTVGGQRILPSLGNAGPDGLGGLNIAEAYLQSGNVTIE